MESPSDLERIQSKYVYKQSGHVKQHEIALVHSVFPSLVTGQWREDDSYNSPASFPNAIIMAVLLPVNMLKMGGTWRKTFQKTPFHWSGLGLADLCTVLIAQPFTAATEFLDCTNFSNKPFTLITIDAIGDTSVTYFISINVFIITLMVAKRQLHMAGKSLMT